jgi:lipocalin
MIKFFRKIRQKLLSENKFSKYMIYAIGEIILVVIGILIALQINNWNEQQKVKSSEIALLKTFKNSLQKDLVNIDWHIEEFRTVDYSINILIRAFNENIPYHDSLNFHFLNSTARWMPSIEQEVYVTMTATDLNIITNDSLKIAIVDFYSFAKRKFDPSISRYANVIENANNNIFNTRFDGLWNTEDRAMIPHDYESLQVDREYNYFINSLKRQLWFEVRDPLNKAKSKSEQLITRIENELMKLDK